MGLGLVCALGSHRSSHPPLFISLGLALRVAISQPTTHSTTGLHSGWLGSQVLPCKNFRLGVREPMSTAAVKPCNNVSTLLTWKHGVDVDRKVSRRGRCIPLLWRLPSHRGHLGPALKAHMQSRSPNEISQLRIAINDGYGLICRATLC